MKKLSTLLIFLFPLFLGAQLSYFAEFSLDPFKDSEYHPTLPEPQTLIKDLSLGTSYDIKDFLTINLGYSRMDSRSVTSSTFYQDNFIDGISPSFFNLTLSHTPVIRSHSVYSGLILNWSRFHLESNIGYALGVFTEEYIQVRESDTFTGIQSVDYFPLDYKNISFFTGELKLAYDVLTSEKGSLALVIKYKKEFSDNLEIEVKGYDPEVKEMVENFPGTSYYDIDDFLSGGPLNYDRDFIGLGLRLRYKI